MEMLQGVWKQHLRPRAVVGYGVKIFLPSPLNYVTRSPGRETQSISANTRKIIFSFLRLFMHYALCLRRFHGEIGALVRSCLCGLRR